MSLVGPRPHAVGMKTGQTESARLVAEYAHRHRMKPGMTGWAAINGSRGPVDTPELVRRRVALDIEYIERQNFWFDFYIMAMTIPCLLGDRDAVR
jgi:lipopolysaccharide/colanic/teichoic acid biosynthesis glycosyltransferase